MMPQNEFDRFGMPEENIRAAQKWADKKRKKSQYDVHVPSRKEVRHLAPKELAPMLIGWMVHSPVEIIPSRVQIMLVIELIEKREDAAALGSLITMCRHYAEGQ
jgi:hypothetical protein